MQKVCLFKMFTGPIIQGQMLPTVTQRFWTGEGMWDDATVYAKGSKGERTFRCAITGVWYPMSQLARDGRGRLVAQHLATNPPIIREVW